MKPGPKAKLYRGTHCCAACRRVLPVEAFRIRRRLSEGVQLWAQRCWECLRQADREGRRNEAYRAQRRRYEAEYYRRTRAHSVQRSRAKSARAVDGLTDGYVRHVLGWEAPPEILQLKRAQLTLLRRLGLRRTHPEKQRKP